jgi:NitT/TauT family transport system substrate-binding protein
MRKSTRQKSANWQLILVMTVIVLSQIYCTKEPDQSTSLLFAQLPITYSAVTYMAEAKGYFKEEGLNYLSISVPAGPDVVTALRGTGSSAADAGGIAITPVITMIGAGVHPVVVATTLSSNRQAKLVTFSHTGITQDPTTLKGKRIGVTRNTNGDIYLSRLLRKGGLNRQDATLVNGRPADLRGLLVRGELDAAVLWDPFVVQTVREYRLQLNDNKIPSRGDPLIWVDSTLHTLAFNIVTTQSKLAKNRDQIIRMLRATIKAENYIRQNRKEAQALLERWLNLQTGDLDDFFATTEFHVHLDVPQLKHWMKEELEWLRETRPDAKRPDDLSNYVDATLLQSVEPNRVKE